MVSYRLTITSYIEVNTKGWAAYPSSQVLQRSVSGAFPTSIALTQVSSSFFHPRKAPRLSCSILHEQCRVLVGLTCRRSDSNWQTPTFLGSVLYQLSYFCRSPTLNANRLLLTSGLRLIHYYVLLQRVCYLLFLVGKTCFRVLQPHFF